MYIRLLAAILLLTPATSPAQPQADLPDPMPLLLAGRSRVAVSTEGHWIAWTEGDGAGINLQIEEVSTRRRSTRHLADSFVQEEYGQPAVYAADVPTLTFATDDTLVYDVNGVQLYSLKMVPDAEPVKLLKYDNIDSPTVQYLAGCGFAVLQVNFRGSTGLGRAQLMGAQRRYVTAALEDVQAAIAWAVDAKAADPDRVAVMGGSYGGLLSLMLAARQPDKVRAVVAIAAPSDLGEFYRSALQDNDWARLRFLETMIADRSKEKALIAQSSPLELADSLTMPVLLIHGDKDHAVDVRHSIRLYDKLKAAGRPVEILRYPRSGHGSWTLDVEADQLRHIGAFLRQSLGETPSEGHATTAD